MGQPILVSEVIESSRVRLGMPAFDSTTYIADAAALDIMKDACARLGALIRRAFGSDYFTTNTTLQTQSGINFVSLPADFSDLRQIAWMQSATQSVPLIHADVDYWLAQGEQQTSWGSGPRYSIQGNVIQLYPCPNQVYTLSLYYDTGIYVTATTDYMVIQPGWKEWLVNDFCIRVRRAEELDASDFLTDRQVAESNILAEAAMRDRFRNYQVRDTWMDGLYVDPRSLWVRR